MTQTRTVLKGELATIAISTSQSLLSTPVGQVISIGDIETKVAEVSTTVMGDTAESRAVPTQPLTMEALPLLCNTIQTHTRHSMAISVKKYAYRFAYMMVPAHW